VIWTFGRDNVRTGHQAVAVADAMSVYLYIPHPSCAKQQVNGGLNRSGVFMEHMIQLHIERLPEGVYLATSDEIQGLVAQGRTLQETVEIARDVAKKLIEAQNHITDDSLTPLRESFDYPLIVAV